MLRLCAVQCYYIDNVFRYIVIPTFYFFVTMKDCFFLTMKDCFARPIASAPDAWFDMVERDWNDGEKVIE